MKKKIIFASIIVCISVVFIFAAINVPDLSVEKITNVKQTLKIFDKDNNEVVSLSAGENRKKVSLSKVSPNVINALIATEDVRFFKHNGIDVYRIFGALWADIKAQKAKEGASTITQQLIKNSHLTSEKTISRKINEAILAIQIENRYSKEEILEMYLNFVYFGRGAYGIETAATEYFGKTAAELSLAEAATLIGVLKAPSKYAPHLDYEASKKRRAVVLEQMEKYGYITKEELLQAKDEEITVIKKEEYVDYGYYTDFVLEQAAQKLNITVADLLGGGYNVYTSLNSSVQNAVQEIYAQKENFPNEEVESASVVIDNLDGSVAALIGGRSHDAMRVFNRATAKRQPGSCIKPILVYAPALESKKYTAATLLEDFRKNFDGYTPTNFKDKYYGRVTLRRAMALSLNVPAVEVFIDNGIEYSKAFAQMLGIKFDKTDTGAALALGGMKYGTSPLELASAYSCFANDGIYKEAWCIKQITSASGEVLYEHKTNQTQVFSDGTAFIITDIMRDVAQSTVLKKYNLDIACKTGTVGYNKLGYSDAWCTGITKNYSVSVWMGYDKTTEETYLSEEITGSTYPTAILGKIFAAAQSAPESFQAPLSVVKQNIDLLELEKSGKVCLVSENTPKAYVLSEYFFANSQPKEATSIWNVPQTLDSVNVYFDELRNLVITFASQGEQYEYMLYKKRDKNEILLFTSGDETNKKISFTDNNFKNDDEYFVVIKHKLLQQENDKKSSKKIKINVQNDN